MSDWVDEIEAQIDETVPYYVPRLIAEIRALRARVADVTHLVFALVADDEAPKP